MSDNRLLIEIQANTRQAQESIEQLQREIRQFSTTTTQANTTLQQQQQRLESLGSSVKRLVGAYAGFSVLKNVVETAGNFQQQMTNLQAITGATGDEFDKLQDKARQLGETTQYSASEVADGMKYLAMAGYKTKDILASVGDILNLATIGQTDLGTASDIASNILGGFNMKADETARVVDVMATTITNSNTNIQDLGYAMSYAAPSAKALGVSVEETATAIGILSNAGIKGSMAGTGLAGVLTRLSAPTGKAKEDLEQLGIKVYDSQGKFIGLQNVLEEFNKKYKNMTQEQKALMTKEIFGDEMAKSALTLIEQVNTGYSDLLKNISKSTGKSDEMAKKMLDTYNNNVKTLKSSLEELAITIGNELLPALTKMVQGFTDGVRDVTEFYKENKELINTIVELTTIFFGLRKVLGIIELVLGASAVRNVIALTSEVSGFRETVRTLITALMGLGKANLVLIALTGAIYGINSALDEWQEKINKIKETNKDLNQSTESFIDITEKMANSMEKVGDVTTYKLTKEEIEDLKKSTLSLIEADKKRIATLKSQDDGTIQYKNKLAQLQERQELLNLTLKKLETIKPYEKAKESAVEYKKEVEKLTEADKKYLKDLETEYKKREKSHESLINNLKKKELNLLNDILEENKNFQTKLKGIEQERVDSIRDIESDIHSIKMSEQSDYRQFIDKQNRAETALAEAKKAIKKGELAEAKKYMSEYKSLMDSIAKHEITQTKKVKKYNFDTHKWEVKQVKDVLVSKQRANAIAINGLKKLEDVTNSYYAKTKAKATEQHNQRIAQLKAQLQVTKAQLEMEVQRLNLEKQLIQALTGKSVEIDTKSALDSIKSLDNQIKQLDTQFKKPKKIDTDIKEAEAKINEFDKSASDKKPVIKIGGDNRESLKALNEFDKKAKSTKPVIDIKANNTEAVSKAKEVKSLVESLNPRLTIETNISQVLSALNSIPKSITTIHYIKDVHTRASGGLIPRYATGGSIDFERKQGRIAGYDPFDTDDVPALLTRGEFVIKRDAVSHYGDDFLYKLNNKMLPKFATGGLVDIKAPETNSTSLINQIGEIKDKKLDISKLDEIITKLKELVSKFGEPEPLQEEAKKEAKKLEDIKNSEIEVFEKEKDFKSSIKGKTVTEEQHTQDKEKIKDYDKELENKKQEEKKELQKAKKTQKEVENYLKKVEKEKEKIQNLLSKYEIDDSVLPEDFENTTKLDELKKLSKKIRTVGRYKSFIKNRFSRLKIDDSYLPDEFDFTLDENRFKRYYNTLKHIRPPRINTQKVNDRAIESKYNGAVNYYLSRLNEARRLSPYGIVNDIELSVARVPREPDKFIASSLLPNESRATQNEIAEYLPNVFNYGNRHPIPDKAKAEIKRVLLARELKNKGISPYPYAADGIIDKSELEEITRNYILNHLPKFQTGGIIDGGVGGKLAGYGGGDRNLALLEDGEFIIRKEAVSGFGADLFHSLNNLQIPKFQTGGLVGNIPTTANQSNELVDVNFNLPSGNSYKMNSKIDVAKALTEELKRLM